MEDERRGGSVAKVPKGKGLRRIPSTYNQPFLLTDPRHCHPGPPAPDAFGIAATISRPGDFDYARAAMEEDTELRPVGRRPPSAAAQLATLVWRKELVLKARAAPHTHRRRRSALSATRAHASSSSPSRAPRRAPAAPSESDTPGHATPVVHARLLLRDAPAAGAHPRHSLTGRTERGVAAAARALPSPSIAAHVRTAAPRAARPTRVHKARRLPTMLERKRTATLAHPPNPYYYTTKLLHY